MHLYCLKYINNVAKKQMQYWKRLKYNFVNIAKFFQEYCKIISATLQKKISYIAIKSFDNIADIFRQYWQNRLIILRKSFFNIAKIFHQYCRNLSPILEEFQKKIVIKNTTLLKYCSDIFQFNNVVEQYYHNISAILNCGIGFMQMSLQ